MTESEAVEPWGFVIAVQDPVPFTERGACCLGDSPFCSLPKMGLLWEMTSNSPGFILVQLVLYCIVYFIGCKPQIRALPRAT